jgi:hypothetical protein
MAPPRTSQRATSHYSIPTKNIANDTPKTSLISVGNSIQAYSTLQFTSRVYNPSPIDPPPTTPKHVTALQSRTFGTWTFLAALIRLYAAYNIENPVV